LNKIFGSIIIAFLLGTFSIIIPLSLIESNNFTGRTDYSENSDNITPSEDKTETVSDLIQIPFMILPSLFIALLFFIYVKKRV
jgi:hypothetical protein